jgi:hypothetical protein
MQTVRPSPIPILGSDEEEEQEATASTASAIVIPGASTPRSILIQPVSTPPRQHSTGSSDEAMDKAVSEEEPLVEKMRKASLIPEAKTPLRTNAEVRRKQRPGAVDIGRRSASIQSPMQRTPSHTLPSTVYSSPKQSILVSSSAHTPHLPQEELDTRSKLRSQASPPRSGELKEAATSSKPKWSEIVGKARRHGLKEKYEAIKKKPATMQAQGQQVASSEPVSTDLASSSNVNVGRTSVLKPLSQENDDAQKPAEPIRDIVPAKVTSPSEATRQEPPPTASSSASISSRANSGRSSSGHLSESRRVFQLTPERLRSHKDAQAWMKNLGVRKLREQGSTPSSADSREVSSATSSRPSPVIAVKSSPAHIVVVPESPTSTPVVRRILAPTALAPFASPKKHANIIEQSIVMDSDMDEDRLGVVDEERESSIVDATDVSPDPIVLQVATDTISRMRMQPLKWKSTTLWLEHRRPP